MSKLKPIKCWDCLYLAKCRNYSEKGCEKFEKFIYSLEDIAKMLNVNYYVLYRKIKKNRLQAMEYINEQLYPKKFRCVKIDKRRVYERYK